MCIFCFVCHTDLHKWSYPFQCVLNIFHYYYIQSCLIPFNCQYMDCDIIYLISAWCYFKIFGCTNHAAKNIPMSMWFFYILQNFLCHKFPGYMMIACLSWFMMCMINPQWSKEGQKIKQNKTNKQKTPRHIFS